MFERYALSEVGTLRERFEVTVGFPKGVKPNYNVSPTQTAPVILMRDGERVLERMKWGFVTQGAKDTNSVFRYKTYVAKSEESLRKNIWNNATRHQRCLVPVSGFYLWKSVPGDKQAYFVQLQSKEVFALAGIYSSWKDPEGVEWGTFAIVTTTANKELSALGERMPLVLHAEDEATWLDPTIFDANSLYTVMRPYFDATPLESYQVGPEVFSAKANTVRLLHPID